MYDAEAVQALLRAGIYLGTVGAAGSVLFALSLPRISVAVAGALRRQALAGSVLVLVVEPIRYIVFQLAIAGGDAAIAFSPALRWLGFETPVGQAGGLRFVAALVLVLAYGRSRLFSVVAALALIASYLLEGHTAAEEEMRALYAGLLLIHIVLVHWWLGALYPLASLIQTNRGADIKGAMDAFSSVAVWAVPLLIAAGGTLLVLLTGLTLDLGNAYQQRFLVKLAFVAAILAIAVRNRFRITPLISNDPAHGASTMRRSIVMEIAVALAILGATAWMLQTGPGDDETQARQMSVERHAGSWGGIGRGGAPRVGHVTRWASSCKF